MTIATGYLTSEGVVFGADSTTTVTMGNSQQLLNHAQKLFEIGKQGVGRFAMVTWGNGIVGQTSHRTIAARVSERITDATTVREVVDLAVAEVRAAAGNVDLGVLGYMIGGWTPGSHAPECYEVTFERPAPPPAPGPAVPVAAPEGSVPSAPPGPAASPAPAPSPAAPTAGAAEPPAPASPAPGVPGASPALPPTAAPSGPTAPLSPPAAAPPPEPPPPLVAKIDQFSIGQARFRGIPLMFLRAYWGYDPDFMRAVWDFLRPHVSGTVPYFDQLLIPAIQHAKMQVLRAGNEDLPIREAIDFVHMYIHLTVKAFKFRIGPPPCGGPIEIGFITTDRLFRWVRHKAFDSAICETGTR